MSNIVTVKMETTVPYAGSISAEITVGRTSLRDLLKGLTILDADASSITVEHPVLSAVELGFGHAILVLTIYNSLAICGWTVDKSGFIKRAYGYKATEAEEKFRKQLALPF